MSSILTSGIIVLQYGGYGKGYMVKGAVFYEVHWTRDDIITNDDNSIIATELEWVV